MIKKNTIKKSKFFQFFLDCISFNTPKAIVVNISVVLVLLAAIPTKIIESGRSTCLFKNALTLILAGACPVDGLFQDCNCPACGLTRATSNLLHGNFSRAIEFNILVVPVIIILLALLGINIYKIVKKVR